MYARGRVFFLAPSPPNSASLYPHHSAPPFLIWTPFLGSLMGLLVWLMHCDLLRLAVYLLRVQNEKKRGGFEGKPEQDEVKTGHPEEF